MCLCCVLTGMTATTDHIPSPSPTGDDMGDSPHFDADRPDRSSSKRPLLIVGILAGLALAAVAAWSVFLGGNAPEAVDGEAAAVARSAAIAESAGDAPVSAAAGIDGVWSVDTSIGAFTEACLTEVCSSTFAGFRIDEELVGVGGVTVVGRTPGVQGQIAIEGTTVTAGEFVVDMTGLVTDSNARNAAIRSQAIETDAFPTSTFVLTEVLDFGSVDAGQTVTVDATGNLTVHGVTQNVTIPLTASLESGVIVVTGQIELALADYGISAPSAPIVASVEDTTVLELQVFLTQ